MKRLAVGLTPFFMPGRSIYKRHPLRFVPVEQVHIGSPRTEIMSVSETQKTTDMAGVERHDVYEFMMNPWRPIADHSIYR
jgi:hypothetical protein